MTFATLLLLLKISQGDIQPMASCPCECSTTPQPWQTDCKGIWLPCSAATATWDRHFTAQNVKEAGTPGQAASLDLLSFSTVVWLVIAMSLSLSCQ
jgi:hypothetical protein